MALPGELIVMARLGEGTQAALRDALAPLQLQPMPDELWPAPRNWHQSLSGRYAPLERSTLLAACNDWAASGHVFHLRLERVGSRGRHVRAEPAGDRCAGLEALLRVGTSVFAAHGLPGPGGHAAHVTLCYGTRRRWPATRIAAVDWHLDAIDLVEVAGSGDAYHYRTVQRWPLLPTGEPAPPEQVGLFR
jgi:2'-5' RNA ligase